MTKDNPLQRRRAPQQTRSQKRIDEILEVTAKLRWDLLKNDAIVPTK